MSRKKKNVYAHSALLAFPRRCREWRCTRLAYYFRSPKNNRRTTYGYCRDCYEKLFMRVMRDGSYESKPLEHYQTCDFRGRRRSPAISMAG